MKQIRKDLKRRRRVDEVIAESRRVKSGLVDERRVCVGAELGSGGSPIGATSDGVLVKRVKQRSEARVVRKGDRRRMKGKRVMSKHWHEEGLESSGKAVVAPLGQEGNGGKQGAHVTKVRNRCVDTGRGRSVIRWFRRSGRQVRERGRKGRLGGVYRVSW